MAPLVANLLNPPLIGDLLETHRAFVNQVLSNFQAHLVKTPQLEPAVEQLQGGVDDLFALRFVLSALSRSTKDVVPRASANLIETIEFRSKNLLAYRKVASLNLTITNFHETLPGGMNQYACDLGPNGVVISKFGSIDLNVLIAKHTPEEILEDALMQNEVFRLFLRQRAIETGRLAKMLFVVDMAGFSMSSVNRAALRIIGQNSKINDVCNPQMVAANIIMNPGLFFRAIYSIGSPFMSKATLDKICICRGSKLSSNSLESCPWASKCVTLRRDMPVEYGGRGGNVA